MVNLIATPLLVDQILFLLLPVGARVQVQAAGTLEEALARLVHNPRGLRVDFMIYYKYK